MLRIQRGRDSHSFSTGGDFPTRIATYSMSDKVYYVNLNSHNTDQRRFKNSHYVPALSDSSPFSKSSRNSRIAPCRSSSNVDASADTPCIVYL